MGAQILNAATGTGAGPAVRSGAMNHAVIVKFTDVTGAVSAVRFKLQGRIAGGGWVDLTFVDLGSGSSGVESIFQAGEITAKIAYRFVKEMPVDDVRINITTLTTNGTCTVDGYYKSEKN